MAWVLCFPYAWEELRGVPEVEEGWWVLNSEDEGNEAVRLLVEGVFGTV